MHTCNHAARRLGHRYESIMLGLFSVFRGFGGGGARVTGELNELHAGFSRDGFHYLRPVGPGGVRVALMPYVEFFVPRYAHARGLVLEREGRRHRVSGTQRRLRRQRQRQRPWETMRESTWDGGRDCVLFAWRAFLTMVTGRFSDRYSYPRKEFPHTDVQSVANGLVVKGDLIYLYAMGRTGQPAWSPGHSPGGNRSMAVAMLRRDGFASIETTDEALEAGHSGHSVRRMRLS